MGWMGGLKREPGEKSTWELNVEHVGKLIQSTKLTLSLVDLEFL